MIRIQLHKFQKNDHFSWLFFTRPTVMLRRPARFSIRNGTLCMQRLTATEISSAGTSVPVFTFGIWPRGPSRRATFITVGSRDVVARHRLKTSSLLKRGWMSSSPPTIEAPAERAESAAGPVAKTRIEGRAASSSGRGKSRTPLTPLDLRSD